MARVWLSKLSDRVLSSASSCLNVGLLLAFPRFHIFLLLLRLYTVCDWVSRLVFLLFPHF
jgi:hypothetical protein